MEKIKKAYSFIYKLLNKAFKAKINCNYKWFGSEYGGFYVCIDSLNKDSIIYSIGIGQDISFDKSIIETFNCDVFGFDPTPKSINWVKNQKIPVNFIFNEYGIDTKTGNVKFFLPKKSEFVSGSKVKHDNIDQQNYITVPMMCLEDITKNLGHNHIDVLKLDIEGSEFEILDSIFNANVTIHQILIEFHDRFIPNGLKKMIGIIETLNSYGYEIFAFSKSYEEISFIRKS